MQVKKALDLRNNILFITGAEQFQLFNQGARNMKLELKSIKYSAFASEETNCFQGNLYVDGKPFASVSNNGHGGPDRVMRHPKSKFDASSYRAKMLEIEAYLVDDLESWCGEAVYDYLLAKELRSRMRRRFVVQIEGKTGLFTSQITSAKTNGDWYYGRRVLNHMPFADALSVWKELSDAEI